MMGIVGALIIARGSWGLVRDTGAVVLDYVPHEVDLPHRIREAIQVEGDRLTDLHIWQVGPGHSAAIISLAAEKLGHIVDTRPGFFTSTSCLI